jgi:hypothetical protein
MKVGLGPLAFSFEKLPIVQFSSKAEHITTKDGSESLTETGTASSPIAKVVPLAKPMADGSQPFGQGASGLPLEDAVHPGKARLFAKSATTSTSIPLLGSTSTSEFENDNTLPKVRPIKNPTGTRGKIEAALPMQPVPPVNSGPVVSPAPQNGVRGSAPRLPLAPPTIVGAASPSAAPANPAAVVAQVPGTESAQLWAKEKEQLVKNNQRLLSDKVSRCLFFETISNGRASCHPGSYF